LRDTRIAVPQTGPGKDSTERIPRREVEEGENVSHRAKQHGIAAMSIYIIAMLKPIKIRIEDITKPGQHKIPSRCQRRCRPIQIIQLWMIHPPPLGAVKVVVLSLASSEVKIVAMSPQDACCQAG
jgi:hypothetical protein